MENNIVKFENNELVIAAGFLEDLKKLNETKILLELQEKKFKNAIMEQFEIHDIKKFENEIIKITRVLPTVRVGVDVEKLKENGLFESYSKQTPVKGSVKIEYR